MTQRFRINASIVASYFKQRCDRLFRWNTVEGRDRGKAGIGWNVPRDIRSHSRPGIALLMEAGDIFEAEQVRTLIDEYGEDQVRHAGIDTEDGRQKVRPFSLHDFFAILQQQPLPRYITQPDLDPLELPGVEESFLQRFGLNGDVVRVGSARPDLIELISSGEQEPHLLRIWDFKASQSARHEHFVQVAYYTFLLEAFVAEAGFSDDYVIDTESAVIYSREGKEEFELAPYRLVVEDFLRNRAPVLFDTPAADAHFHVREKCALCEYMTTCQEEADAGSDLSRIPYMSSESKRRLRDAGFATHRDLARLTFQADQGNLVETLRATSHDLSVNIHRYVANAEALEDGNPRTLGTSTLLMPRWENVRVVLSAEQDPVTNTCFALGIKTFEGWDETHNRPIGSEEVFISESPDQEADILLTLLRTLNILLTRIDNENRNISEQPIDNDERVVRTRQELEEAESALNQFKTRFPRLYRRDPQFEELNEQREELKEAVKQAKGELRQAERNANWDLYRRQITLHFYVYDGLDLTVLKSLIERHLFDPDPALLDEIRFLVRLFPPESILPDAETFRSIPGTIVTQVLRSMVALPIPYIYELRAVSEMYRPTNQAGDDAGYRFLPRYGFGWRHSNQVAFERIHDVWKGQGFVPDSRNPDRVLSPTQIRQTIERTVLDKLRATDSVVRKIKQDLGDGLLLRKEPFRLFDAFDPLDFQMLEAMRVFTILEASLDELSVKNIHALPIEDRTAKFVCIRGLHYIPDADEGDGTLWFTFDPASSDAKFSEGDFNLVLTQENQPGTLLGEVDGRLFDPSRWRHRPFKATLEELDLISDPPRVRLRPDDLAKMLENIDLNETCVLDQLYVDYNSPKVLAVLERLRTEPALARHINELVASGTIQGWQPQIADVGEVEQILRDQVAQSGNNADTFLNRAQWGTFRGVFQEPLTLIWGPPGTGKTYILAHILLGYAMAAQYYDRPLRILVTAFTHHAIGNVLRKASELAELYGLGPEQIAFAKAQGGHPHSADDLLADQIERIYDGRMADYFNQDTQCLIVGSTVWGVHKAMNNAGRVVQPWFDVILVDEASQMKLPDALIAMSSGRPEANVILAGDDRQLPPIIHGTYPEEHEHMLTSVFAFMRYRMEQRAEEEPDVEQRMLFQLEENFRMNEPLTAYPREVLYNGRFFSQQPDIRISTDPEPLAEDAIDFMLHPDRPVVLCWYTSPVSFTARNPLEAELVAGLTNRLSEILIDTETGQVYDDNGFAAEGIAVLSPHRAQNSTIRQALAALGFDGVQRPRPLVDTVDKLQGQERDVVLVSYGVADEEYAEAEADFLLSSNRFNVATTRPKHKLIVFCSDGVLNVVPDDRRVLLDSMMLKEFRRYCDDGHTEFTWRSPEFGAVTLHVQWKGFDN